MAKKESQDNSRRMTKSKSEEGERGGEDGEDGDGESPWWRVYKATAMKAVI